jgi:hypothetical protein
LLSVRRWAESYLDQASQRPGDTREVNVLGNKKLNPVRACGTAGKPYPPGDGHCPAAATSA